MRFSCFISVMLVLLADQVSKWWMLEHVFKSRVLPAREDAGGMPFVEWLTTAQDRMPYTQIEILPFFNLVMVWNRGVSFGLFNDDSLYGPLLLLAMAAVIVVAFSIWLMRTANGVTATGLILIIGGALGNMLDRARFGAVADFLDVHAFGYHWPAFNIADSTICVGIAILLVHGLFFETKHQPSPAGKEA